MRRKRLTPWGWLRWQIRWIKFKREHRELLEWAKEHRP